MTFLNRRKNQLLQMTKRFLCLMILCVLYPVMGYAQIDDTTIIRVELKPQKQAKINSPMTGRIVALSIKDGDVVKKGQKLVSFECSEFKAQVAQASARVSRQNKLLASTQKLYDLGSASTTDLNVLKAELSEAKASQQLAQSLVNKCYVNAPFSGHVSSLSVKNHSSLQEGEAMVELVGGSSLDIEMIIPSKWMRTLKKGDTFHVEIEETGTRYKSKILRYGGKVDPITQSVKLYAQINEEASELLPGMSGVAYFDFPNSEQKIETDDTIIPQTTSEKTESITGSN